MTVKAKLMVKKMRLIPRDFEEGGVKLRVYDASEERWEALELKLRDSSELMNRMIEVAGNEVVMEHPSGEYVYVTVEAPGLSVTIGEGEVQEALTLISPRPSSLRRVKLMKADESGNLRAVKEIKPPGEVLVYDGYLWIPQDVSYDLVLVETVDDVRVLFPHELILPQIKIGEAKKRRRSRRARSRKKKGKKRGG